MVDRTPPTNWGDVIARKDAEIERLRAALEVTSSDCAEAFAENERLRAALEEVKALVFGANHSETRYPLARAELEGK